MTHHVDVILPNVVKLTTMVVIIGLVLVLQWIRALMLHHQLKSKISPKLVISVENSNRDVNPGNNIYVCRLSKQTRERDLEDLFAKYGKVWPALAFISKNI